MAAKRKAKERVQNYLSLSPEIEVELLDIDYPEIEVEPLELKIEPLELELMEIERLSLWEGSLSTYN